MLLMVACIKSQVVFAPTYLVETVLNMCIITNTMHTRQSMKRYSLIPRMAAYRSGNGSYYRFSKCILTCDAHGRL